MKSHEFEHYFTMSLLGAGIAERSSQSTFEHLYAMPWAIRSILNDDNSFSAQA